MRGVRPSSDATRSVTRMMLPHLRGLNYLETYHPPRFATFEEPNDPPLIGILTASTLLSVILPSMQEGLCNDVVPLVLCGVDVDAEHVSQLVDTLLGDRDDSLTMRRDEKRPAVALRESSRLNPVIV